MKCANDGQIAFDGPKYPSLPRFTPLREGGENRSMGNVMAGWEKGDRDMERQTRSAQAKLSRKQTAYEYIKDKILSCEYGPGSMMNEQSLCDELELSRTPVRDALSRLEQEGLVNIMPKKGLMVSSLKLADVNHIYEVRMLLETYALRRYGRNLDLEEMRKLRRQMEEQAVTAGKVSDQYDLDDAFHMTIMQTVNNRYLMSTYENIKDQNLRVRVLSGNQVKNRLADTFKEHTAIIDACLQEDWEEAAQAMARHLENARVAVFPFLIGEDLVF